VHAVGKSIHCIQERKFGVLGVVSEKVLALTLRTMS
jgi:hypothetical protein